MAMALLPLAFEVGKSIYDASQAQSKDAAMQQAGQDKINAMRQGAGQVNAYRQSLTPQMLQAMQNQMGAYGGAQNVLSQMYGGPPPMGQRIQPGTAPPGGTYSAIAGRPLIGQMQAPGPAINPGTPGGARAGANPYFGQQQVPNMGFGGEMPMPLDLMRRRVG